MEISLFGEYTPGLITNIFFLHGEKNFVYTFEWGSFFILFSFIFNHLFAFYNFLALLKNGFFWSNYVIVGFLGALIQINNISVLKSNLD